MSVVRDDGVSCGAVFSDDRVYRYVLTRFWTPGSANASTAYFVGLNPSTADELTDDPTVRRCIGFARDWGCDGMVMLNAFAFRATDPRDMKAAADPIGPDNDSHLRAWTWHPRPTDVVVACWGCHGDHKLRGRHVQQLLREECGDRQRPYVGSERPDPYDCLFTFGLTKDGHPKHPLYLAKTTRVVRWA